MRLCMDGLKEGKKERVSFLQPPSVCTYIYCLFERGDLASILPSSIQYVLLATVCQVFISFGLGSKRRLKRASLASATTTSQ